MLYRAFLNIILNGIQAMETGGRLVVETQEGEEGQIIVSFRDNGPGMSAPDRAITKEDVKMSSSANVMVSSAKVP